MKLSLLVAIAAFGLGCAPSSDEASANDDGLSGPVSIERACALKKAYAAADLGAFTPIAKSDLPPAITTTNPISLSTMTPAGLDLVYVVEEASATSFYDRRGVLLARATNSSPLVWSAPTGAALVCAGDPTPTPTLAPTKLADGDDLVLLGVAGDDAIYQTLAPDGGRAAAYAVPLAGGPPTKLFDLATTDSITLANGGVVGHWLGLTGPLGTLEVWTRRRGLVRNVAMSSVAGLLRSSDDGTRIAFGLDATVSGTKVTSTALAVRDLSQPANMDTLDGTHRANLAASATCPLRLVFKGRTMLTQHCTGTEATESRARLVALPGDGSVLRRIDGATLDSPGSLAGNAIFSADAEGEHIVTAAAAGTGVIYRLRSPRSRSIEAARSYTMLPDGSAVLYRTSANDLFTVPTSDGAPTKLASGVLGLLSLSSDGKTVLFNKKPRDPTNLTDVNLVSTREPQERLLTKTGLALGFTSDSSTAIYVDAPNSVATTRSTPVSGGPSRELMKGGVGGRPALAGSGVIVFTNIKTGTATTPLVAEISYLDAKNGGAVTSLATEVPLAANDTELFISGNRVVFTDLTNTKQGIYAVTLP